MKNEWVEGFKIEVRSEEDSVTISANKAGLLSLAKQLNTLAGIKVGSHIHLDDTNSLEDGSAELVIEKIR